MLEIFARKIWLFEKNGNCFASVCGSTYLWEQIFSHMKFILSFHRSRLTEDHSEACVQLKVTRYSPNITELSKEKDLIKNILVTAFSFFSVIKLMK